MFCARNEQASHPLDALTTSATVADTLVVLQGSPVMLGAKITADCSPVLSLTVSEELLSFYMVFELERKKLIHLGKVTARWAPKLHASDCRFCLSKLR